MKQVRIGKKIVNVSDIDYGVGFGFPVGTLVMRDISDSRWYSLTVSGSVGSASVYVSSPLTLFGTASYYDQNMNYQLVAGSDSNTYQVYLSASVVVVNPNMWATGSFIKSFEGAIIPTCKPSLLFQNITSGDFFSANLQTSASVMTLNINQTPISRSWIRQ